MQVYVPDVTADGCRERLRLVVVRGQCVERVRRNGFRCGLCWHLGRVEGVRTRNAARFAGGGLGRVLGVEVRPDVVHQPVDMLLLPARFLVFLPQNPPDLLDVLGRQARQMLVQLLEVPRLHLVPHELVHDLAGTLGREQLPEVRGADGRGILCGRCLFRGRYRRGGFCLGRLLRLGLFIGLSRAVLSAECRFGTRTV